MILGFPFPILFPALATSKPALLGLFRQAPKSCAGAVAEAAQGLGEVFRERIRW